ncbi:MAG: elongation factor G [Myxococcaceae bacterium]|nr:elongation factor G [Myxococcaceae bacterium]
MTTPLHRSRLFGVLAHVDAGKTTVSERMLFASGRIHRLGEVHQGTATLDHTSEEKKHGITISAAASSFTWQPQGLEPHHLTLIDTPGHVDFAIEVERSLRVLDGAVVVLDASKGVEPQTESVWRHVTRAGVPRLVFVNKLDAPGASVERCLDDLRQRFGVRPVLLQTVLDDGSLVDLVSRQRFAFTPDGTAQGLPVLDVGTMSTLRERLVEAVAEHDDAVLQGWSADEDVSVEQLRSGLRRATLSHQLVPVLCGAALKNRGVPLVLDAIVHYLPSPLERVLPEGLRADLERGACGFVFKTEVDPHLGSLAWTRLFQGVVEPSDALVVRPANRRERVARVLGLHAGQFEPMRRLGPGGIAALVGLKSAKTGDTVCAPEVEVTLEPLVTAEPVVELALTAKSSEQQTKLGEALRRACLEDPSLSVRVDVETGQTVLCGVGELHLSIWLEKLARRDGLEVKASAPAVSVRDTVSGDATVTYRHVRQNSGPGQFAVVTVQVTPRPRASGFHFVSRVEGGAVPAEFIPAVERGARNALSRGVREGAPVIDVEVTLLDGEVHVADSSALAFEVAGSLAVQQAVAQAGLVRLEPVAAVEVSVPESHLGAALGEVALRRGKVQGLAQVGEGQVISARMPVAKTFGFVTSLRSRTEGRGVVSMTFSGFEPAQG